MAVDARRIIVVLNPRSGPAKEDRAETKVRDALGTAGIEPDIILLQNGVDIRDLINRKAGQGCNVVVAAGGDGTVSAVGSLLAGTDVALGILPTGTLNHFARDLGLPTELEAAAEVIAQGQTTLVDVGEVNGRVFLNNSSIGLYPTVVSERAKLMRRGMPKSLAGCLAAIVALWRFPETMIRVMTESTGLATRTPLVFVGNNRYEYSGMQAGRRARLNDGLLQVSTLNQSSRSALVKAALLAIGRVNVEPDILMLDTRWAKVVTLRRRVKVALDGEVVRLRSPLTFSIRPQALTVIVDRRSGEEREP